MPAPSLMAAVGGAAFVGMLALLVLLDRKPAAGATPSASSLRARLGQAGFDSALAPALFFAVKLGLGLALALLALSLSPIPPRGTPRMYAQLLVAAVAMAGFFVPNLWLTRRVERHLLELSQAVPDFLDLLTTCVEAGLSAEAAVVRLAQDLAPAAPALAAELNRVVAALQSGAQPEDALRSAAERTDLPELFALTRLFSENRTFGTNLAPALREEATALRAERARRAEEAAAKAVVKLMLPTLLCLLPSVLLVILGPLLLQLFSSLSTLE